MTVPVETRFKNLETGLLHFQRIQEEHYESLNNDFANRTESQFNLLQYLLKQHQILKEVFKSLASELKVDQAHMTELWIKAEEKAVTSSIQDQIVDQYRKESREDNDRD